MWCQGQNPGIPPCWANVLLPELHLQSRLSSETSALQLLFSGMYLKYSSQQPSLSTSLQKAYLNECHLKYYDFYMVLYSHGTF